MKKIIIYIILVLLHCSCHKEASDNIPCPAAQPEKMIILNELKHPWSICFLDETDVLITEKDGNLIRADLNKKTRTIIEGFPADLADSIRVKDFRDNSGIFEVIKHPDFKSNRLIYISYAAQNNTGTTTKIIRAKLENDKLSEIQPIFIAEPFSADLFHYGGGMTFGKDGKLYFTIGERLYNERDEPPLPIAQDLSDKRGKIYRLNSDGSVPEDNPDFGSNAQAGIYALGIRAAQGITVNPENGSIWFSEHGSTQGDELNLLQKGANYGWPIKTSGKYRNPEYQAPPMEGTAFTEPVHYWLQTIAPTGLVFYTGKAFPGWNGDIILSGLSRGSLWRIHLEENQVISLEELFVNNRVRSRKVALSPGGKLYILTDEKNGKLVEIRNAANNN